MAIECDHPRPPLNLPGYVPPRLAWQVPSYIPGLDGNAARIIRDAFQGIYNELTKQGRTRNVIPLIEDLYAQPGSVISGVGNGQTVTLLPPGADGYLDPVTIIITDLIEPVTVVHPDGSSTVLDDVGSVDFQPAGPDEYETIPGIGLSGAYPGLTVPGRPGTTTGAVSPITAAGRRQVLAVNGAGTVLGFRPMGEIMPGAPIYDVMAHPFNATGNGLADDTAAINAAIAAANVTPGIICLGRAHRITAALTTVTNNNVVIQGRGRFNGGTQVLIDAPSAADFLFFDRCQYVAVRDIWFSGAGALYSSGATIRFYGTFQARAERLLITQLGNGIEVQAAVLTTIDTCTIGDIYGTYGIWFHGDNPFYAHALQVEHCLLSTNFPHAVVGFTRNWQASTAYVIGNTVTANGNIYQAVSNGTSAGAGTGPSGIPGTTVATAHTATVTDGTVSWVLAMPQTQWYLFDSFAHTMRLIDSGALQGGYGIRMIDSDGLGGASAPHFLRVVNTELDHVTTCGISLEAGAQAEFEQTFITSMLNGPAIAIASTFDGLWRFNGGLLYASGVELVTIAAGDGSISDFIIGGGGLFAANTYDAIRVDAGVQRFSIENCSLGQMAGAMFPSTRYAISVASGCDNYTIQSNRFLGNLTGPILNTPGVATTRIVRNNIPDTTGIMPEARIRGRGLGVGDGEELNLTGAEAGAVIRFAGFTGTTVASGTYNNYAIADGVKLLDIQPSGGDVTFTGFAQAGGNAGGFFALALFGTGGRIILRHNTGSSAGNLIFTPGGVDYILTTQLEMVWIVFFNTRWQVVARPWHAIRKNSTGSDFFRRRLNLIEGTGVTLTVSDDSTNDEVDVTVASSVTGLTDGDKGDITVSGSGTVWNIDPGVVGATELATDAVTTIKILDANVTLAKQANLAQSRIVGRAEGAGTGVPQALTPTEVVAIIDAENATWTGTHAFTGSSVTVASSGVAEVVGASDVAMGSTAGGVSLGAGASGHIIHSPSVGNGDILINATNGVAINAAASPVTSVAAGEVQLTGSLFDFSASGTVVVSSGSTLTLAASTSVVIGSPLEVQSVAVFESRVALTATLANSTAGPVDNLNIGNVTSITFSAAALLSGMVPATDGQEVRLINTGGSDVAILLESSSSAANRFAGVGTSRHIKPGEMALAWYDTTVNRWRLLCRDDSDL